MPAEGVLLAALLRAEGAVGPSVAFRVHPEDADCAARAVDERDARLLAGAPRRVRTLLTRQRRLLEALGGNLLQGVGVQVQLPCPALIGAPRYGFEEKHGLPALGKPKPGHRQLVRLHLAAEDL